MTNEDKLRFEIGYGFDKLSKKTLHNLKKTYKKIMREKIAAYNYDGDSPYYEAVSEFCHYLRNTYKNDEEFAQSVLECCGFDTFGWVLDQINDRDLYKYARNKMEKIIMDITGDPDDIESYLDCPELPE